MTHEIYRFNFPRSESEMTGMCLKKGNSVSHRERFSLQTWAISIIKNEEKKILFL